MTSSSPNEWFQQYLYNPIVPTTSTTAVSEPQFSDSIVSSTVTTATPPPPINTTFLSPPQDERPRISKPSRKRSRASRKNPTTLLNTDTSNFRAMVQMYTGGNTSAFDPSSQLAFNVHQGQIRNFNQPGGVSSLLGLHYTSSSPPPAAFDIHQRLLLQNTDVGPVRGPTFSLTSDINATSPMSLPTDSADQDGPTNWIGF